MSNRMKWVGVIGMFCWFVCGLSMGLVHMKLWQDRYYAAHPVVKEVPVEVKTYLSTDSRHGWVHMDHGAYCVVVSENEPLRPNWESGNCGTPPKEYMPAPPAKPASKRSLAGKYECGDSGHELCVAGMVYGAKPAMTEHAPDYIDCDEQGKGAKCTRPKPEKSFIKEQEHAASQCAKAGGTWVITQRKDSGGSYCEYPHPKPAKASKVSAHGALSPLLNMLDIRTTRGLAKFYITIPPAEGHWEIMATDRVNAILRLGSTSWTESEWKDCKPCADDRKVEAIAEERWKKLADEQQAVKP